MNTTLLNTVCDFITGLRELLSKPPEQLTDVLLGVGLRAACGRPHRLLDHDEVGLELRGAPGHRLAALADNLDGGVVEGIDHADRI